MKLCTTSNILRKMDDGTPVPFEESIRFAAGLGFQEIDLSLDTPLLTQPGWEKEIEQRVNTVAHAGLSVRYMRPPSAPEAKAGAHTLGTTFRLRSGPFYACGVG